MPERKKREIEITPIPAGPQDPMEPVTVPDDDELQWGEIGEPEKEEEPILVPSHRQ